MIKLIIIFIIIYVSIRIGRMIRKGVLTFKVFSSNYSNLSEDNEGGQIKIEEAEYEDITDKDE